MVGIYLWLFDNLDGPYRTIIFILEEQEDELLPDINGTNCNDYMNVHNSYNTQRFLITVVIVTMVGEKNH